MNDNLNLAEILKDCPEGTKLYSTMFGEVEFLGIGSHINPLYKIDFRAENGVFSSVTADGKYFDDLNGECTLFPSKDQRDWSKFKYKKPKFDPKTLKPFDRVLVRDFNAWKCALYSHMVENENSSYKHITTDSTYICCIPYNNDTKYLLGTKKGAPEYYRYWED